MQPLPDRCAAPQLQPTGLYQPVHAARHTQSEPGDLTVFTHDRSNRDGVLRSASAAPERLCVRRRLSNMVCARIVIASGCCSVPNHTNMMSITVSLLPRQLTGSCAFSPSHYTLEVNRIARSCRPLMTRAQSWFVSSSLETDC